MDEVESRGPVRAPAGLRDARRPAAGAVACAAALVSVYWAAVRTVPGRVLDGRSLRGALLTESTAAAWLERGLDLISVSALLCAVCGIWLIALARRRRAVGVGALVVLAGANVSTQLLKSVLLTRPDLGLDERTPATLNSLPSGHVTVAFSAVVALVLVLPARLRGPVSTLGVAAASAVTMAVMSSGWHRASDALAACLVVGVWAGLVLVLLGLLPAPRRAQASMGRATVLLRRTALVLGGLGAFLALALLAVPAPAGVLVLVGAYAAGVSLTAGAAAAVLHMVLAQLHRRDQERAA